MIKYFFLLSVIFAACTHSNLKDETSPVPVATPVVKKSIAVTPRETPPPAIGSLDEVMSIAVDSTCAKTAHGEQGLPSKSFLKGIALTYARAACDMNRESVKVASKEIGDAKKDALAHYGLSASTPEKRLAIVYALMVGSAARESSWRWCVGKDPGADNTDSETCEAGLYQTSYNSRTAHPVLPKLYSDFKKSNVGCFESIYKGKTTCSEYNLKNWGSGEGVEFQRLSKYCPGFATEYHSVMLRTQRTHYGPINRKKVTFVQSCADMFEKIGGYIAAKRGTCLAF